MWEPPLWNESKEDYIRRNEERFLELAELLYNLGNERASWDHLFTWVQVREILDPHWEKVMEMRKAMGVA